MLTDHVYVSGLGVAEVGRTAVAEAVARGDWDAAPARASGLISVSVAGDTPAPDLAVQAGRAALTQAAIAPGEFGALLHACVHPQGPDGWSAPHYVNRHTLNQPVLSAEIHNGCVGFFSALRFAAVLLARPGPDAVLLTCADNFGTPAVDRWTASRLFALADGGSAAVLSRRPGFARLLAIASACDPEHEERHRSGEPLFPPGLTRGAKLNFAERTDHFAARVAAGLRPPVADFGWAVAEVAQKALKQAGIGPDDVAVVIHDGHHRDVLDATVLDVIGVDFGRGIFDHTRTTGHAGPADQLRGLHHAWQQGRAGRGDHVLMISDAPGMEASGAVLEILETP